MIAIFAIGAGLTHTFGKMAGDRRQGWALFGAMGMLFLMGVTAGDLGRAARQSAIRGDRASIRRATASQTGGNMEGKEVRFGIVDSALWATVTTDTSCGAVNAMHDSFTPLGGLVPLLNIQIGEIIFGGVGSGLYGMLVMAVLSVFIAGLMVGRTPEYLGKKIEGREMKLAMLFILIFPAVILLPAGDRDRDQGRTCGHQQSRPARLLANPLRLLGGLGQQRLGLRRAERQHASSTT